MLTIQFQVIVSGTVFYAFEGPFSVLVCLLGVLQSCGMLIVSIMALVAIFRALICPNEMSKKCSLCLGVE